MSRLLVVSSERISAWIEKGEVVGRYYNPGDVFDEVDLLLLSNDEPDPTALRRMAGRATMRLHHYGIPRRDFAWTIGWRPALLRRRLAGAVNFAASLRPDLIRTYGARLDAFVAAELARRHNVPFAVSLHINPDVDLRGRHSSVRAWVSSRAIKRAERDALRAADLVLPVYRSIVPYLESLGVDRYEVAYNVINPDHLCLKDDYAIHGGGRLLCVGRQFREKDPSNIVRAVASLPGVQLTLVGSGPRHDGLRELARELGIADRVDLLPAVPSDELCESLPGYDLAVFHSEYWELSKAMLEALLTGLPVVVNRRTGGPVPELTPDLCVYVDNTASGYADAIRALLADRVTREELGRTASARAAMQWSPSVTEARFAAIYRRLLGKSAPSTNAI